MLIGHLDSTVHHLLFSPLVSHTLSNLDGVAPIGERRGSPSVPGGVVLNGSFAVDPQTLLPALVTGVLTGIPTVASLLGCRVRPRRPGPHGAHRRR